MRNRSILAHKIAFLISFVLFNLFLSSCQGDGVPRNQVKDMEEYIADNNLTVTTKTEEGPYYIKLEDGDGTALNVGNNVTVKYKGNLLNGEVFDSGTFSFTLGGGRVVRGFDIGIMQMELGEKAIIIFPSSLGYGSSGQGPIPRNSPLVFEIEVVEVK